MMNKNIAKFLIRFQNPKVIIAVVAGVLAILVNTGIIPVESANHYTDLVNTVLSIGVAVGIFGNPDSHIQQDEQPTEQQQQ